MIAIAQAAECRSVSFDCVGTILTEPTGSIEPCKGPCPNATALTQVSNALNFVPKDSAGTSSESQTARPWLLFSRVISLID